MTAQHTSDGSVRRRLVRRWYEDGLSETVVGGVILLIGLCWIVVDATDGLRRAAGAAALLPMPQRLGYTVLFTTVRLALILRGTITLVRYLRRQALQADAEQ